MFDRILPFETLAGLTVSGGMRWAALPSDVSSTLSSIVRENRTFPLSVGASPKPGLVSLRVGYLYCDARLLIAGAPALANVATRQIGIAVEEVQNWVAHVLPIRTDCREGLHSVEVGGHANEQMLGPNVRAVLASNSTGAYFTDVKRRAFSSRPGKTMLLPTLPDAIVLHTDFIPKKISLTLEATTACNFKCGFCYGRHLPQGLIRADDVARVLDNLDDVTAVEITGEGEPLVNRQIFKIIEEIKKRGIWVHLTTNGSRLSEGIIARVLDSGVDRLATSLESVNAQRYERLRPGGNFITFKEGLLRLAESRSRRVRRPELFLWITLLRECVEELDAMFTFAKEIGFDRVEVQALNAMPAYTRGYDDAMQRNALTLPELRKVAERVGLSEEARASLQELVDVYQGSDCAIFDSSAMVYWQGAITPCRLLKLPDVPPMGDLTKTPFAELWERPEFKRFRFALRHGMIMQCCKGCAYVHSAASPS